MTINRQQASLAYGLLFALQTKGPCYRLTSLHGRVGKRLLRKEHPGTKSIHVKRPAQRLQHLTAVNVSALRPSQLRQGTKPPTKKVSPSTVVNKIRINALSITVSTTAQP